MKAVNDRILIQKGIIPDRTKGGIFIAAGVSTDAKVKLNIGKVLSVGSGTRFHDGYVVVPTVEEGEVVMWEQFGDIQAEVIGENKVVVRWEDVIGVLDPDEYKDWIFDMDEYRRVQEKIQKQLEESKKSREVEAATIKKIVSCRNSKCIYVTKPVEDKEQCEYCGSIMEEIEDKKGPSIFVQGGASKPRV